MRIFDMNFERVNIILIHFLKLNIYKNEKKSIIIS